MADYTYPNPLNTQQGNPTEAEGLGVPVFGEAKHQAGDVLWFNLQQAENEKKKSQAAARQALSSINDIKVNGYPTHLTELNSKANDLKEKAVNYMSKYKGKSWEEFDPRNPEQTKEALDIQKARGELEQAVNYSMQAKDNIGKTEAIINANRKNLTPESIAEFERFAKLPIKEQMDYITEHGTFPDVKKEYFDYDEAMKIAPKLGYYLSQREPAGGYKYTDKQVLNSTVDNFVASVLGGADQDAEGWGARKIEKVAKANPKASSQEIHDIAFKEIKESLLPFLKTEHRKVMSQVEIDRQKKQGEWQREGNTFRKDTNVWTLDRYDDGTVVATMGHTDKDKNTPLEFIIGTGENNKKSVTGIPVRYEQKKGEEAVLFIKVDNNVDFTIDDGTGNKTHIKGGAGDVVPIPYHDADATIKNEYGTNPEALKQMMESGTVTNTVGGNKASTSKSSGTKKMVSLQSVKNLVGKKGYEGYTEQELIDYYKSQGYNIQ